MMSDGDLAASVMGVSVWAPGLPGWKIARPVLAGEAAVTDIAQTLPVPSILPPTERRRAGPVIRLALAVAGEAVANAGIDPAALRCVFGSSNGDGLVVGSILEGLATAGPGERVVSPTQFHNSVHNAPAGYWSIAHGSRQPATCLGAHDATWAASLLKAMVEVASENEPVLLCCYDHPLPAPLDALRPTAAPFAVGLVLAPSRRGMPLLRVGWRSGHADAAVLTDGLDELRRGNAIAASLPLLVALASRSTGAHRVAYLDGSLVVGLEGV